MEKEKAIGILQAVKAGTADAFIRKAAIKDALDMAISALEKQEQSCDTCRHGRFGDKACINCRVGFPNHYEAEEEA